MDLKETERHLSVRFLFSLSFNRDSQDMRYTCKLCDVMEYGGSIGNPGLFGRMFAHLQEGHDVHRHCSREVIVEQTGDDTLEVSLDVLPPSPQPPADEPEASSFPATSEADQWMPRRSVCREFLVDTNCVNARQKLSDMNRLEVWAENDVIQLLTTEIAQTEMLAGGNSLRASKAYNLLFTMSAITSEQERRTLSQIEEILFPRGATDSNQRNDAEIVFNSLKYMRPLITNDGGSKTQPGGILGNRAKLAQLGVKILNPAEAVAEIENEIAFRDESTRRMASMLNLPVPEWVGKD